MIPARGSADILSQVLFSLLRQTFVEARPDHVKLIVVEDGVPDGSFSVFSNPSVKKALKYLKDYKVDVAKETLPFNARRAGARNAGICKADGEIIFFVDASMILDRHFLAEQIWRHSRVRLPIALLGFKQDISLTELANQHENIARGTARADPRLDWKWSHTLKAFEAPRGSIDVRGRRINVGERINYMALTDYLQDMSANEEIGTRTLASFFQTNIVSAPLPLVFDLGGFDQNLQVWGLEDTLLGALLVSFGCRLIPCPSSIAFNVVDECEDTDKEAALAINRPLYQDLITKIPAIDYNRTRLFGVSQPRANPKSAKQQKRSSERVLLMSERSSWDRLLDDNGSELRTLAELLGTDKTLAKRLILKWKNTTRHPETTRRRAAERQALLAGLRSQALLQYYGLKDSGLCRYDAEVDGYQSPTSIYSTEERVGMTVAAEELAVQLVSSPSTVASEESVRGLCRRTLRYLLTSGVRFWNQSMYRLHDATVSGPMRLRFSVGDYFSYRFSTAMLEDELAEDLLRSPDYSGDTVLSGGLVRERLLPTGSLLSFGARMCAGGVCAVSAFARRRENDFIIPLHVRSDRVADGRGLLSVLPKAAHQPSVGDLLVEANPYWTVLREVYEEIFQGREVEMDPQHLKYDWYCDRQPALGYLRDNEGGSRIDTVGFGVDVLNGNYLLAFLAVTPDPVYWDQFGALLGPMWEHSQDRVVVSSKDTAGIARLVRDRHWSSDALFTFLEGMRLLGLRFPDRVDLPSFRRFLAGADVDAMQSSKR